VVLFARVVAIGESAIMSGCAPVVLPPLWRIEILDLRDRLTRASGRPLDATDVRRARAALFVLFHRAFEEILNPRVPTLVRLECSWPITSGTTNRRHPSCEWTSIS
jgi:hypothetical protein